uniref:Transmembrane protein n=1 Tax=Clastoptera arizonana TaxID=38151 RepID=A0A1B6E7Q2_9HEMI
MWEKLKSFARGFNQSPSYSLSREARKIHYYVYPLLYLSKAWFVSTTVLCGWMFATRDHRLDKKKLPVNERMDLLEPHYLKLKVIEPYLKPAKELHEIYQAMAQAQRDRDECVCDGEPKKKEKK